VEAIKRFLAVNSGSGSGSGSGYGSGSGISAFAGQPVYNVDDVQTLIYHVHGNMAKGAILNSDLTLSPCYIVKSGNLFAHGETLQKAQEALRNKLFEDMPEEERIDAFLDEIKPGIPYPARLFFEWHNRLTGSCEMGRRAFAADHGIDVDGDTMTLERFIELTENAYGGDVIHHVKERMQQ